MKQKETNGIIRYLRYVNINDDIMQINDDNMGGIVFIIDILHDTQELRVKFCTCSREDNFDKGYGLCVAKYSIPIVIKYDSKLSLVSNCIAGFNAIPKSEVVQNGKLRACVKEINNICRYNTEIIYG